MSDGEIEVEAVSGYQVLPKDVVAEIGSVKLFSMSMLPACLHLRKPNTYQTTTIRQMEL